MPLAILILLFIGTTVVRAQLADSPWPTYKGNNKNTGLSPYDTSRNTGQLKWEFITGGMIDSTPAIGSDGTIHFGSYDGYLYAVNPDGSEKWKYAVAKNNERAAVRGAVAIASDGTIYTVALHDLADATGNIDGEVKTFGSSSGRGVIYAINPDGTLKWSYDKITQYNGIPPAPKIGNDGTLYIGTGLFTGGDKPDGRLIAFRPDGTVKWTYDPPSGGTVGIADDGTLYTTFQDDQHEMYVVALNPDGSTKWKYFVGKGIDCAPAIAADGTIYVGSQDKHLYAINADGTLKWKFAATDWVESSPAIGPDGTIYVGTSEFGKDVNIYAINPDGTKKWSFPTGAGVYPSVAIGSEGTIYAGSRDGYFYAINPDGTEKWKFKPPGAKNGSVYQSTTSAAIDKDGTIYYGAVNGHLYALGTNSKDMMAGVVKSPTKDMLTIYLAGAVAIVLIVGAIIVLKKFRIRRP
ncbi:PQQ-binding-like beta-propeller repeat protein [Candidatus Berkelbacteria bacterium]|nr:PQQ-binding-like beta-propeller repeat protein [Candidatus Berkelbacteria bacterium]